MPARSAFFAGDYTGCCEAASRESSTAEVRSIWFRALLNLGQFEEARKLIKGTTGALDLALSLYATGFPLRNEPNNNNYEWNRLIVQAEAVGGVEGEQNEAAVILSIIYSWAGKLEDAYRLASQSTLLEAQLLLVTFCLKLGRIDIAERKLEKLGRLHKDEVAFQLVEAELAISKGGSNVKDALYIYQGLSEAYGRTVKLLNAQAGTCLLMGRFSEAETLILQVLQLNPHEPLALSHLINLSISRGVGTHLVSDQLARLAVADRNAPLLKKLERAAIEFENVSVQLAL